MPASEDQDQHVGVSGDVFFHIIHNSSMRRLEVVVQQCHNLAVVNSKKKCSNPYVVFSSLYDAVWILCAPLSYIVRYVN